MTRQAPSAIVRTTSLALGRSRMTPTLLSGKQRVIVGSIVTLRGRPDWFFERRLQQSRENWRPAGFVVVDKAIAKHARRQTREGRRQA